MTRAVKTFVEADFAKYEQRITELENQVRLLADQLKNSHPAELFAPAQLRPPHAAPSRKLE